MVFRGANNFTQDASKLIPTTKTIKPPKCAKYQKFVDHFKSVPQRGHGAFLGNPAPVENALRSFSDICSAQIGHSFNNFKDVGTAA